MAKGKAKAGRDQVDLSESSVWGDRDATDRTNATADGDTATNTALDRLEAITAGAEDPIILDGELAEGELGSQFDGLDASTDEEVDALQVNLFEDDELPDAGDGSGYIVDDIAKERIGKLTETGPFEDGQNTVSVSPGRDDTSATLRRHHRNAGTARFNDMAEGNVDEPRDQIKSDVQTDEGTGA